MSTFIPPADLLNPWIEQLMSARDHLQPQFNEREYGQNLYSIAGENLHAKISIHIFVTLLEPFRLAYRIDMFLDKEHKHAPADLIEIATQVTQIEDEMEQNGYIREEAGMSLIPVYGLVNGGYW